jgi:hypothetical protein
MTVFNSLPANRDNILLTRLLNIFKQYNGLNACRLNPFFQPFTFG